MENDIVFQDFNLISDDLFYQETDDSTLSQLLTISTQQLDDITDNLASPSCTQYSPVHDLKPTVGGAHGSDRAHRYAAPIGPEAIEAKKRGTTPTTTQSTNNWTTAVWKDWAIFRNSQAETMNEPGYPIPQDISSFQLFETMDYWLQRFIHEIRRKDGKPYPPDTLSQITAGLQRYLRNDKQMLVNFFTKEDPTFAGFRRSLDSRMRELTNEGVGVETKRADPISPEDEKQLWNSGVFTMNSAKGLSNAVFFYNGKVFGFRGGTEHIGVMAEQFSMGYNEENQRRYIKFTPRIRKNAQGGLKQSKTVKALMTPIIQFDNPNSECSVYRIYESYLNLIPRVGPFYKKTMDGLRFSAGTISQRDLKGMMKRFFTEAGISMENRNISNHSGRVTLCSTLYNNKFSDKSVMSRSKHCSNAVRIYQREDLNLLNDISNTLEPVLPENKPNINVKSAVQPPVTVDLPRDTKENKENLKLDINNNIKTEKNEECMPSSGFLKIIVPANITVVEIVKGSKKVKLEL